jgi:energy-coupling factor transporter transmembrane protein EcfT
MKDNLLSKIDGRIKLIVTLLLMGISGIMARKILGIILFVILAFAVILVPEKKKFVQRIFLFLPFILVTFLFPLFFTPGRIIGYGITYEGIYRGSILAGRLFLVIGYSLVFTLSTSPIEIAKSLDWLTLNKLGLGKALLIALKFSEIVKKRISHSKHLKKASFTSILEDVVKESKEL